MRSSNPTTDGIQEANRDLEGQPRSPVDGEGFSRSGIVALIYNSQEGWKALSIPCPLCSMWASLIMREKFSCSYRRPDAEVPYDFDGGPDRDAQQSKQC